MLFYLKIDRDVLGVISQLWSHDYYWRASETLSGVTQLGGKIWGYLFILCGCMEVIFVL